MQPPVVSNRPPGPGRKMSQISIPNPNWRMKAVARVNSWNGVAKPPQRVPRLSTGSGKSGSSNSAPSSGVKRTAAGVAKPLWKAGSKPLPPSGPQKPKKVQSSPSSNTGTNSSGVSGGESPPTNLCERMILTLDEKIAWMSLKEITGAFPSSKVTRRGKWSIDWSNLFLLGGLNQRHFFELSVQTQEIILKIGNVFETGIEVGDQEMLLPEEVGGVKEVEVEGVNRNLETELSKPYISEILAHELGKEEKYEELFRKHPLDKVKIDLGYRAATLDWMMGAAKRYNYSVEMLCQAVFILDAFLHSRNVKPDAWALVGLTVFQLAAKSEEVERTNLRTVMKDYPILKSILKKDVIRMEVIVLSALEFNYSPPSAKLFVDILINGGQIDFPNEGVKRSVYNLTFEILRQSLSQLSHSRVRASVKARIALEIACEYTMYLLARSGQLPQNITENSRCTIQTVPCHSECFELFCELVNPRPLLGRSNSAKVVRGH